MMETAKIRRAGYPIRHSYNDFVARYRYLAPGIGPAHKENCREAAEKICNYFLKKAGGDFQFGHTKVFLKDADDALLEAERSRIYLKHVLVLQRGFRRVIFKKWIKKHRDAAILIQKTFRARGYRKNYLIRRTGFRRLQAVVQSRQLTHRFQLMRKNITAIQAQCRGFLIRKNLKGKIAEKSRKMQELMVLRRKEESDFKKANDPKWRENAEANYLSRVSELSKEYALIKEVPRPKEIIHKINSEEDSRFVDEVFGYLEPTSPEFKSKHQVSNLLSFFEKRSKEKKRIPSKILSRPVTYHDFNYMSSRL